MRRDSRPETYLHYIDCTYEWFTENKQTYKYYQYYIGDICNVANNSLTRKVTKTNNNDVMTSMKISFHCNISLSKIILYTGKFKLAWSITMAAGYTQRTTSEFGQSHILDLSEFDSSIKEISISSVDNGQFTLKGLRLGGFQKIH